MQRRSFIIAWIGAGGLLLSAAAQADVLLTRDGAAIASIVIADAPTPQTQRAADVLQTFLQRVSGARLPITAENGAPQGPRILVGRSGVVEALGIEIPDGCTTQLKEEGYVVKTTDGCLVLAGNEAGNYQGTLYAVYDALHALGCRWFFPGPFGEVIPELPSISFPDTNRVERPSFRFRNIWYSGWMPVSEEDARWFSEWCERNRVNSLAGLSLPGDGTLTRLVPPEKYFESRPELFAIGKDGERQRDMICPTEPEAMHIAAESIKQCFRDHPGQITFGFGPPDGNPRCLCPRCEAAVQGFSGKGFGDPSLSDLWFIFANGVASEVYPEFPDRWILTNGYANRVRPPEGVGPLSPNLGIQSAMLSTCTLHQIDDPRCRQRQIYAQILRRWTDSLNCVFVYDYDPGKALDGTPFTSLRLLEHDLRWLHDRGVWGFWTEGQNIWMSTLLNYYARARLMWNVNSRTKSIVRDFCSRFYGPAAKPMERYLNTLESALDETPVHTWWSRPVPWLRVLQGREGRLEQCVRQAEQNITGEPFATRVHALRLMHDHLMAYVAMERAAAQGDFTHALAQTGRMLRLRDELENIQHGLLPRDNPLATGEGFSVSAWNSVLDGLAARTDGRKGRMITLLPRQWSFQTDPHDEGVLYAWYNPEYNANWRFVDVCDYWEHQGEQDDQGRGYWGKSWYRTAFELPDVPEGRTLILTLAGVATDRDTGGNRAIWVWVNGQLAGAPAGRIDHFRPLDIEVTRYARPGGTNTVAVLVQANRLEATQHNGLYRRAFVWSPSENGG